MDIDSYARRIIQKEFERRQAKNISYSMRALARDLEISPGYLWDFISGKRALSQKKAIKIAEALKVKDLDKKSFILSSQCTKDDYEIGGELYQLVSYWHHFAVLSLSKDPNNQADPKWIAKRLVIEESEADEALTLLVKLGLVKIKEGRMNPFEKKTTETSLEKAAFNKIDMNFFNQVVLRLKEKKLMGLMSQLLN